MIELDREVEGAYPEMPEPGHLEQCLEGAVDFVVGTESLTGSYTKAQQYLWGCLEASDTIDYRTRVGGMENFVTDGLGAIWDYIKKIFKAVWNFFFGSGDDSVEATTEKAEKAIEANTETLKDVKKTGKSEAQVKKVTEGVKKTAKKIKESPSSTPAEKKEAEAVIEELDKAQDLGLMVREAAAARMAERIGKINKQERQFLIKKVGECENLRRDFVNYAKKDRKDEVSTGRFKSIYDQFHTTLQRSNLDTEIGDLIKVDSIQTIGNALDVQARLKKAVERNYEIAKFIKAEKSDIESDIKALEEELKKKKVATKDRAVLGEGYKDKNELSKRLSAAKVLLGIIAATGSYQLKMTHAVERLSQSVVDIFGKFAKYEG